MFIKISIKSPLWGQNLFKIQRGLNYYSSRTPPLLNQSANFSKIIHNSNIFSKNFYKQPKTKVMEGLYITDFYTKTLINYVYILLMNQYLPSAKGLGNIGLQNTGGPIRRKARNFLRYIFALLLFPIASEIRSLALKFRCAGITYFGQFQTQLGEIKSSLKSVYIFASQAHQESMKPKIS